MQAELKIIINKLSIKYKMDVSLVEEIVTSQFKCARAVTKQGVSGDPDTFLNIRFLHIGLLTSKPRYIKKIDEILNKNKDE